MIHVGVRAKPFSWKQAYYFTQGWLGQVRSRADKCRLLEDRWKEQSVKKSSQNFSRPHVMRSNSDRSDDRITPPFLVDSPSIPSKP